MIHLCNMLLNEAHKERHLQH